MNTSYNICIVDDDNIYQFTMIKTLKSIPSTDKIIVFSDGERALNFLTENIDKENKLPDVIFLDINMPIMDGFQFMEEYVKIKPNVGKKITIYMVSSSVDPADIQRAKNISDISDYIIKPIKSGELRTLIQNLKTKDNL